MTKQFSMYKFNRLDRTYFFNTTNMYYAKQNQALKIMFSHDALRNAKIKLKLNLS